MADTLDKRVRTVTHQRVSFKFTPLTQCGDTCFDGLSVPAQHRDLTPRYVAIYVSKWNSNNSPFDTTSGVL
jgi:hypothetical protein